MKERGTLAMRLLPWDCPHLWAPACPRGVRSPSEGECTGCPRSAPPWCPQHCPPWWEGRGSRVCMAEDDWLSSFHVCASAKTLQGEDEGRGAA